jgi:hypothetical protein
MEGQGCLVLNGTEGRGVVQGLGIPRISIQGNSITPRKNSSCFVGQNRAEGGT